MTGIGITPKLPYWRIGVLSATLTVVHIKDVTTPPICAIFSGLPAVVVVIQHCDMQHVAVIHCNCTKCYHNYMTSLPAKSEPTREHWNQLGITPSTTTTFKS